MSLQGRESTIWVTTESPGTAHRRLLGSPASTKVVTRRKMRFRTMKAEQSLSVRVATRSARRVRPAGDAKYRTWCRSELGVRWRAASWGMYVIVYQQIYKNVKNE